MKKRCHNENDCSYERYGAKGIEVCEEWRSDFTVFYDWAVHNGYSDNLTIERLNNDKGYSPDNCTWVLHEEQAKNKGNNILIEHDGEVKILAEWCKIYKFPYRKAIQRYRTAKKKNQNILLEDLFYQGNYSVRKINQYTLDGVLVKTWDSMTDIAKAGFCRTNVSKCCNGKCKKSGGYMWKYAEKKETP